ncbi:hypothetical protein [Mycolicibacterium sp.]|uniref:hypothetical protein n=1 Tax=Mycolicibacterium sp. TaxID=2320850 RepID=UPI003D0F2654
MFAALDLTSGQLFNRLRDRKRSQEFLEFLRQLRRRLPTGRLFIVCDTSPRADRPSSARGAPLTMSSCRDPRRMLPGLGWT